MLGTLLVILGVLCHQELLYTARLKLALRQAGGMRCSSDLFLTVISVYAPTFRAPRHNSGIICSCSA